MPALSKPACMIAAAMAIESATYGVFTSALTNQANRRVPAGAGGRPPDTRPVEREVGRHVVSDPRELSAKNSPTQQRIAVAAGTRAKTAPPRPRLSKAAAATPSCNTSTTHQTPPRARGRKFVIRPTAKRAASIDAASAVAPRARPRRNEYGAAR
jgi:hypothetical protein